MENIFGITETNSFEVGGVHISTNHAVIQKDDKFYIGYRFEQDNSVEALSDLMGAENNKSNIVEQYYNNGVKNWKILDELHLGLVNGKPRVWSGNWKNKGDNVVQKIKANDMDYEATIMQYYVKTLYTPEHNLHSQMSKKECLEKFSMLLDNLNYTIVEDKKKLN